MSKRILLLEDDKTLALTLQELLEDEGYHITLVFDGEQAAIMSYEEKFDLYIFDINVPEINGLELLEGLREADDKTPTIFISALIDLNSMTKAFNIGARDYIKKPFFPEELILRVNAKFTQQERVIYFKHLSYNPKTSILKDNNEIVSLGEMQHCLFKLFIHNIDKIIDKSQLSDCLEYPTPTALRVALNKLKKTLKIEIKNIRSVGYMFESR
jgi:DNA-binding response OmpR family regulator